jgi:hypothetical protein
MGLSVTYADMTLNNLKVGATYNLKDLIGYPFKVSYRGERNVGITIDVIVPPKNLIRKEGIDPVPDISWIKVLTNHFLLQPGESGNTDILLTIPDDKKLMGKTYQITLNTHTDSTGGGIIGIGVNTSLVLKIAEKEETGDEKRRRLANELTNKMSFNVVPDKVFAFDVETGRKVDLKKEHQASFKIVNTSSDKLVAKVYCMPVETSDVGAPNGYDVPPAEFLTLDTAMVKIAPDNIKEVKLFVNFPKDEKYAKKRHFFVIKVEPLNQVVKVSYYVRVYVETK